MIRTFFWVFIYISLATISVQAGDQSGSGSSIKTQQPQVTVKQITIIFRNKDKNKDGKVVIDKVAKHQRASFKKMVKLADKNKDDALSLQEYLSLFANKKGMKSEDSIATTKETGRPNVLVILVDDLGYGDLSCFGAKDLKSPHIDSLASDGMKWTNFYANSCVCSPTRAALLSGRNPEMVGVPGVVRTHKHNNWGYLSADANLLPKVLKSAGYKSAIIGKWHLGLEKPNRPNDQGFDYFHGFLGDMMDDYYHHRRHGNNYMRENEKILKPTGHATDLFSDWACDYLKKQKKEKPFFLYLAYNAPHTPIQPPKSWVTKVQKREKGISLKRAKLVALIEHLDAGVGKVLATLKEMGLEKNTLVLFVSDNGGQSNVGANNGPLRAGKGAMYEGGIKVPMIARWPGKIPKGSVQSRIGITSDLYPTICEIVTAKVNHKIDGASLAGTLLGKKEDLKPRDLFFIRREGGLAYAGQTISAVRRGDWKLLQNSPFAPYELYNLKDDPQEKNNMVQKNRKIFRELSQTLSVQIQRGGRIPWQAPREQVGQKQ